MFIEFFVCCLFFDWLFRLNFFDFRLSFFRLLYLNGLNLVSFFFLLSSLCLYLVILQFHFNHLCKEIVLHLLVNLFLAVIVQRLLNFFELWVSVDLRRLVVVIYSINKFQRDIVVRIYNDNIIFFFEVILFILFLFTYQQSVLIVFLEVEASEIQLFVVIRDDCID